MINILIDTDTQLRLRLIKDSKTQMNCTEITPFLLSSDVQRHNYQGTSEAVTEVHPQPQV